MANLTRRSLLKSAGAVSLAGAGIAGAHAIEPEYPIKRLHGLHDEASRLMAVHNEVMGGEWELRIRAPQDRSPVLYKQLNEPPREQALWHLRELRRLALENGASDADVALTGFYGGDCLLLGINHGGGTLDFDGMLTPKGGVL